MNKMKLCAAMSAAVLLCTGLPALAAEGDVTMSRITLLGDADNSENVSVSDVVKLSRFLLQRDSDVSVNADLTADNRIDGFDLALLKAMLLGKYKPQDFTKLVINEVCASNKKSWSDADGREPDWLELYNGSGEAVDISGYGLADGKKNLFKYVFPEGTVIPAGGYLMVCCDDGLASTDASEHHVPFKLSASGETIYLTHPAYGTLDVLEVPAAETDISYGRCEDASGTLSNLTPTPNASNNTAQRVVVVAAPEFSVESGFYASEFQLSITAPEGCTIRYTTDGTDPRTSATARNYENDLRIYDNTSEPNVHSAGKDITLYEDADPNFKVDKGHVIRAVCTDAQGNCSDVLTKSYYVGKTAAYYQDMKVVSLVTDPANLFDEQIGIYVVGKAYYDWRNSAGFDAAMDAWDTRNPTNYNQSGKEWERPAAVQVFEQGALAYEGNVGIRITGNASRSNQQKSIRLYARSDYGNSKMDYAFFDGLTDINGEPIAEFDKVTIRNHGNDGSDAQMRDDIAQELAADMALSCQASEECILFIDGEFWGFYTLKERLEDDYIQSHYGIDKNNVTTIKVGEIEGDMIVGQSYIDFYDWAISADMRDPDNYQRVCDTIDMQSFMDYITLENYICNWDWCNEFGTNNWHMWRVNEPVEGNPYGDGKWRYMVFDTEYAAGLYNDAKTSHAFDAFGNMSKDRTWKNIGALFFKLLENDTFKAEFDANYRRHVETSFDYETRVKPLIDSYKAQRKDATCTTFKRFQGSWGERLASQYDMSIQMLHNFYKNRARYALQYLDKYTGNGSGIVVPADGNLVGDMSLWKLYTDDVGGAGTLTASDDGVLKVNVTSTSVNTWGVQPLFTPVTLERGKKYCFTYTVRGDSNGQISAFVQRNAEPYDTFVWNKENVGTSDKTFTYTFTAKEDCNILKAGFDCGYGTGTYYISNVSLKCVG